MIVLECASCGTQYPADLKKQWGKTKETAGYGPTICCTALVPQSGNPDDTDGPREVCLGVLGAIDATAPAKLVTLNPIGE